jgi:hypothetical protein
MLFIENRLNLIQDRGNRMKITHAQAERLLHEDHSFSQLGFSMMLTRLKGLYHSDPSHEALEHAVNEINVFLEKFKGIMKSDIMKISDLERIQLC